MKERRPVAFIHLPPRHKDGLSEFALIDYDGYILRPRVKAKFTLPVINGIRESEAIEDRRARVHRVTSMLQAIGPLAAHISEVDAADPNNLVVARAYGQPCSQSDARGRKLLGADVQLP